MLGQDPDDPCIIRDYNGQGEFFFTSIPDERARKKDAARAAELVRRWNAFEAGGEVEGMREAMRLARKTLKWIPGDLPKEALQALDRHLGHPHTAQGYHQKARKP